MTLLIFIGCGQNRSKGVGLAEAKAAKDAIKESLNDPPCRLDRRWHPNHTSKAGTGFKEITGLRHIIVER